MGRGAQENSGTTLLYGPPQRRRLGSEDPVSSPVDDETWRVGDNAIWYPRWAPGPVDVVLVDFPGGLRADVDVRITTPDIEETGQIWSAYLSELEPA